MAYTRTFEDYTPPRRYDSLPFTQALIRESATETGTYTTIDTKTLSPVDADPSAPASRNFTTDDATLAAGWYVIRWQDAASSVFDSDPVYFPSGGVAFATAEDVQTRLLRDLTDAELAAANLLLDGVAQEIAAAVGRDLDDITDPGPLRFISIEAVCRVLSNPQGARSTSEELGAYSYSISFSDDGSGLLTTAEERQAREAVFGVVSASARVESIADDVLDYRFDGEVDGS